MMWCSLYDSIKLELIHHLFQPLSGLPTCLPYSMQALALHCKDTLLHLDVSFCRAVSESALGLVADSCASLASLSLFGCSHIGREFLYGHSNEKLAQGLVVGTGTLMCEA